MENFALKLILLIIKYLYVVWIIGVSRLQRFFFFFQILERFYSMKIDFYRIYFDKYNFSLFLSFLQDRGIN